jgi:hypothetical protein
MIKWTKPSGAEIETNDLPETVVACEAMGWERAKPKRGRKPKADE